MSQTYFTLLTAVGEAKLANAAALNTPLQISRMAVGDGNGNLPVPTRERTALVNEQYRADLNELKVDPANPSQIIAELVIPETTGGWWMRELGLYDADGDLIAYANCPPSYKPQMAEGSGRVQLLRMVMIISSTAAVQLKTDPTVVLATRAYVDAKVLEELNKQDFKFSALVATTAAIALNGLQTIDGVALTAGARVLVKNQALAKENGLYTVAADAWTRAQDADTSAEVTSGMLVHIERGGANADTIWQLVTDGLITIGTTDLAFEMAAGPTGVVVGTYTSVTVDRYGRVVAGLNPPAVAALSRVTSVNSNTTLVSGQMGLVLIDAAAGNCTITLPPADSSLGVVDVIVRRVDDSGYRLVVQAAGVNKIKFHIPLNADGYSFLVLMGAGDWWHLRSDGAGNWWPVGRMDGTALGRPVFETTTLFSPGGYGALNGSLLNRADWPWLWDHAQQSGMLTTEAARTGMEGRWTSGDGATTFRCPDARGRFLRPLDESAGVDPSRVGGSSQLDDFKTHAHYIGSTTYGTQGMGGGSVTYAAWSGGNTGAVGGSETRPKNIAYPARMKMI